MALEAGGVAEPGVGEGDLDLAHDPTGQAFDPRDGQDHEGRTATDGQGPEATHDPAAMDEMTRAASGAAAGPGILVDGEGHLAAVRVGAGVLGAADAEGVGQQAGGHADLPVWSPGTQLQVESACPPFSTPRTLLPDEPNFRGAVQESGSVIVPVTVTGTSLPLGGQSVVLSAVAVIVGGMVSGWLNWARAGTSRLALGVPIPVTRS